ncbi:hypothetical protein ORV05_22910 [Amycolatopsis cynarae]|uniref:HEAT repeat domain-containing protein n=1 Tax=Amycolatopsis cynarae TaxID=2995223 RepID=A0ABY7AV67_9PSEU|nr:hypothetical protein [Amycolatopsis sp. HUAS 11-8]WAL63831.1 hypothetical protein ORV05_22910 [Amycolatopsis sp. HUAS 11-8]
MTDVSRRRHLTAEVSHCHPYAEPYGALGDGTAAMIESAAEFGAGRDSAWRDVTVRLSAALNKKSSKNTLQRLSRDPSENVRAAAFARLGDREKNSG